MFNIPVSPVILCEYKSLHASNREKVLGQPRLHKETLFQKQQIKTKHEFQMYRTATLLSEYQEEQEEEEEEGKK